MKKILICMSLLSCLNADVYEFSGSADYNVANLDNRYINTLDLIFNNDHRFEYGRLTISPGVFINDRSSYNSVVKGNVARVEEIYLNEAYYTQYIGDSGFSLSAGLFPYRKGSFYEYGFNGYRSGNGIYSITDINLEGFILSYKAKETVIQIGDVRYEKYFKSSKDYKQTDGSITFESYNNSGMTYIELKQTHDKWYLDIQISDTEQYVNDVKIIDSDIVSIGLSYNDDAVSGRTYYGIYSHSSSKGDTSSLIPAMGLKPMLPPDEKHIRNDSLHFDSFKTEGYYYLLGVKQELDHMIFNKDLVLGLEYGYRSAGYHNLLAGRPLSPHSYADIGKFYNVSVGVRIDKANVVKLRYLIYDTEDVSTKYGFSPVTTKSSNVPGSKDRYSYWMLHWYIDF